MTVTPKNGDVWIHGSPRRAAFVFLGSHYGWNGNVAAPLTFDATAHAHLLNDRTYVGNINDVFVALIKICSPDPAADNAAGAVWVRVASHFADIVFVAPTSFVLRNSGWHRVGSALLHHRQESTVRGRLQKTRGQPR